MSTPYIGEIRTVGFNYAPPGWLMCQGQSLPISQYEALYILLGTTYGGDGVSSFNLPNLQSRLVVGAGQGPGLSAYRQGEMGGTESVTLTTNQLPPHTHAVTAAVGAATGGTAQASPAGAYPGTATGNLYGSAATAGATLASPVVNGTAQPAGGNQPHSNMQPMLAINYIICVEGIYPSRP